MNILTGVVPMDRGNIVFDGQPIEQPTVPLTEKLGIAFVHQELNLFPTMKVYENLFLCREYVNKLGTLKKRQMIERAKVLFDEMGVQIDPTALVSDLKMGQKQLLEIAKALLFDAKLLILDEPTTALNNEEIDRLFEILRDLRGKGKSFIFISHKIEYLIYCIRKGLLEHHRRNARHTVINSRRSISRALNQRYSYLFL
jgi:ribose transport system ATP-binding protein